MEMIEPRRMVALENTEAVDDSRWKVVGCDQVPQHGGNGQFSLGRARTGSTVEYHLQLTGDFSEGDLVLVQKRTGDWGYSLYRLYRLENDVLTQITNDSCVADVEGLEGWMFSPETGNLVHLVAYPTTEEACWFPIEAGKQPYFRIIREGWSFDTLLQQLSVLDQRLTADLAAVLRMTMGQVDPMAKRERQAIADRNAAQEATRAIAAALAQAVSGEDPQPLTGLLGGPPSDKRTLASQLVEQTSGLHEQCRLAVQDIPFLPDGHLVPDKPRPKKR